MILIFKFVPTDHPDTPDQWVCVGTAPDDSQMGVLPDGEYAIFEPTKTTVGEGPDTDEPLPKSFSFDRRVVVETPVPKPKVKAA